MLALRARLALETAKIASKAEAPCCVGGCDSESVCACARVRVRVCVRVLVVCMCANVSYPRRPQGLQLQRLAEAKARREGRTAAAVPILMMAMAHHMYRIDNVVQVAS